MNLTEWIHARLTATVTAAAVWHQSVPQGTDFPAVVHQLVSDIPTYVKGPSRKHGTARIQVDVYLELDLWN